MQILKGYHFTFKKADYLLIGLLCYLSYPIVCGLLFDDTTADMFFCSFIHACAAAIVMFLVVSKSLMKDSPRANMAIVFILINLLYFGASSVKYFQPELYPGFINDNYIRMIFSLLGLFALWVSFEVISRMETKVVTPELKISHGYLLRLSITLLLGIAVCLSLFELYQKGLGYAYLNNTNFIEAAMERTSLPTIQKFYLWLISSIEVFLVILISIDFAGKRKWTLLMISFALVALESMLSGSRGILFYFSLGMMYSMIRLHNLGNKTFVKILLTAPMVICLGSIVILSSSGRMDRDNERLKFQLTYRFDLTDYAATIIQGNSPIMFNPQIIKDAFYYSVPKILCEDKYERDTKSVQSLLTNADLDVKTDYTDTFFSLGAQMGGMIGFMTIPMIMVFFLYSLEWLLYVLFRNSANIMIVAMYPLYITVETDLNSLIASWRMMPVYALVGLAAYSVFVKRKKTALRSKIQSKVFGRQRIRVSRDALSHM